MNLEKMEELANWLEQGAPHIVFDMYHGMASIAGILEDVDEESPFAEKVRIEMGQKGIGECGTVCCIAGYAAKLTNPRIAPHWFIVRANALQILGLPADHGNFYGHDLFDPELAPKDCTPQQAAVAVRRVMEGKEPWT